MVARLRRVASRSSMSVSSSDELLQSSKAGGMVIRGSAWRLGGNLTGIAAGVGTAPLLLHLGVVQSGRYVALLSLAATAGMIVDTGLNVSASRSQRPGTPSARVGRDERGGSDCRGAGRAGRRARGAAGDEADRGRRLRTLRDGAAHQVAALLFGALVQI